MQIQTVLGPTLMHEHLFIAFPGTEFDPAAFIAGTHRSVAHAAQART